jgi:hypothetical protein
MTVLPFSSLSPQALDQAAAIFRDAVFGGDPAGYLYEVDAASGLLTGQRRSAGGVERHTHNHRPSTPPFAIHTGNRLDLGKQAARVLARLLLESTVPAPVVSAEAG